MFLCASGRVKLFSLIKYFETFLLSLLLKTIGTITSCESMTARIRQYNVCPRFNTHVDRNILYVIFVDRFETNVLYINVPEKANSKHKYISIS